MAEEPSTSSCSTGSTSSSASVEPEVDDQPDLHKRSKARLFVPVTKRKMSGKDHVGEAVELLNVIVERDPTEGLLSFMRDEAEKARNYKLEMTNSC